jgi:glycosyltransferase involved in cell wall biosynthesis
MTWTGSFFWRHSSEFWLVVSGQRSSRTETRLNKRRLLYQAATSDGVCKHSMRVLFAMPGLHRYARGAEVAFISVAIELARAGDLVTLIGSGQPSSATPYRFVHATSSARENFESFPVMPVLRSEYVYEELTFAPALLRRYRPMDYDVTLTCSYPFTNWILRRKAWGGCRPPHVFVTENGDWPAYANNSEYRFFGCEGLVCTNPDFFERNKARWECRLIPNGVDCNRFGPGAPQRREFGLPTDRLVVLMVSALIPTKRVEIGIEAVSQIPDAHLVVAGDGPLRHAVDALAARLLPGRFTRLSVVPEQMPELYRSADIFMHLSREEAFGNVFIEALACGLPIVAEDSPRTRWIVGAQEFLLDTSDPGGIAQNIELARAAPMDRRLSRVNRASAFSWFKIGEMYREFLQEVVARTKART